MFMWIRRGQSTFPSPERTLRYRYQITSHVYWLVLSHVTWFKKGRLKFILIVVFFSQWENPGSKKLNNMFIFCLFLKILFIFLDRGEGTEREGERNIDVRQTHWSAASPMGPDHGSNLQPRPVPGAGIEPTTFHFIGQCTTNWDTLVRANNFLN